MLAPHAVDIASHHSLLHYVSHLPKHSTTFFSSSSQVVHWSAEIQTKVYDPRKEGSTDRPTDRPTDLLFRILQNSRKNEAGLKFFISNLASLSCRIALNYCNCKQRVSDFHRYLSFNAILPLSVRVFVNTVEALFADTLGSNCSWSLTTETSSYKQTLEF